MILYSILLFVAGALHLPAFLERYKVSKVIAYTYLGAGVVQIILGLLILTSEFQHLFVLAFWISVFLIIVWLISQIPFSKKIKQSREPITWHVILRKLTELLIVLI